MSAISAFRTALTKRLRERGLSIAPWHGGARASWHLLELPTDPKPTVLYVKESNLPRGWWGLGTFRLAGDGDYKINERSHVALVGLSPRKGDDCERGI
jgi:hypothetical protein